MISGYGFVFWVFMKRHGVVVFLHFHLFIFFLFKKIFNMAFTAGCCGIRSNGVYILTY